MKNKKYQQQYMLDIQTILNLYNQKNIAEAYDLAINIVDKYPNSEFLFNVLGALAANLFKHQEAIAHYNKAISIKPDYAEAYYNLGNTFMDIYHYEDAIKIYNKAIFIKPNYAEALNNLGNVFKKLDKFNEAIDVYNKAISIKPNYAEALNNLGNVLQDINKYQEAIEYYQKAISLKSDYADAFTNLGNALSKLRKFDDAILCHDKAISINHIHIEAFNNLGNVLQDMNKYQEAIEYYQKAISLKPDYADAFTNLGNALSKLRKFDDAILCHDKAIDINQYFHEAIFNKSLILLLSGKFEEGFALYESRWKSKKFTSRKRNFIQPLWLGNFALDEKTILIHSEQGLGDSIQFSRYLKMFENIKCKVILEVEKPLVSLMKHFNEISLIVEKGQHLPNFDCHIPMMSLPYAFKTTMATIPNIYSINEYFDQFNHKVRYWKIKLDSMKRQKIGIAWNGSKIHNNNANRSIPLKTILKYLPPQFDYICIQKEIDDSDELLLKEFNIDFYGNELIDFSDTAAMLLNLDLVVSVDTSVAHLAATLGITTFILLPFASDWRWLLDRDDSPWYPSAKLFRQGNMGDWNNILIRLQTGISDYLIDKK